MFPKMPAKTAADYLGLSLQALHKQLKTKQLPTQKSQNKLFFGHNTAKEIFKLKVKPTVISTAIVKGGVGKTTLTLSIATQLSLYGLRVCLIDLDQQQNLTQACGIDSSDKPVMIDIIQQDLDPKSCLVEVSDGLSLLPSRIDNAILDNLIIVNTLPVDRVFKDISDSLRDDFDFIFFDCPPSLGASISAASIASDYVLSFVDPERFSLSGLDVTLSELKSMEKKFKKNIPVKIVLNKFDQRTNLSHDMLYTLLNDDRYKDKLFKAFVRESQEFPNNNAKNTTIFDTLRQTPGKEDVDILAREIILHSLQKEDVTEPSRTVTA